MMKTDNKGWVVLNTYSTDWEAHIAKGALENAGIPAVIQNEDFASVYPIGFNSIGGLPLLVPAAKAAEAREILKLD